MRQAGARGVGGAPPSVVGGVGACLGPGRGVVEAARCPQPLVPIVGKRALCRAACQPLAAELCAAFTDREARRCQRGIVTTCVATAPSVCAVMGVGPVGPTGPTGPTGPEGPS